LEAERALQLGIADFADIRHKLFEKINSPDPQLACGAFQLLLRAHLPGDDLDPILNPTEVGMAYTAARIRVVDLGRTSTSSELTKICNCWLSLVEMHGATMPSALTLAQTAQETLENSSQDWKVGRQVLSGEGILIPGMSVGSSRFNAARTEQILEWLNAQRPDALLMITDRPARHNRIALGDSEKEAEKYCLKKDGNFATTAHKC